MTAKIFRNSMVVGLSVFLLTVALFMSMLYQYFQEQFTAQLENEAALVSAGVEAMGQDYLDGLSYREIAQRLDKEPKAVDNAVQRIRRKLARNPNLGDISKS